MKRQDRRPMQAPGPRFDLLDRRARQPRATPAPSGQRARHRTNRSRRHSISSRPPSPPIAHLSDEQQRMVRGLTRSGRGVDVVIAPAGAGKTVALAAAHHAWTSGRLPRTRLRRRRQSRPATRTRNRYPLRHHRLTHRPALRTCPSRAQRADRRRSRHGRHPHPRSPHRRLPPRQRQARTRRRLQTTPRDPSRRPARGTRSHARWYPPRHQPTSTRRLGTRRTRPAARRRPRTSPQRLPHSRPHHPRPDRARSPNPPGRRLHHRPPLRRTRTHARQPLDRRAHAQPPRPRRTPPAAATSPDPRSTSTAGLTKPATAS